MKTWATSTPSHCVVTMDDTGTSQTTQTGHADSMILIAQPAWLHPTTRWSTRDVLRAACAQAAFNCADAELLRLGENALYRLARQGVVVRISRLLNYLGGQPGVATRGLVQPSHGLISSASHGGDG